jgi:branched-chain amino acid transport system ATP-binding protein
MLRLANVEVRYEHVVLVLKGLSLEVPEGHIVALVGANGAGKSTTLKAVSGLLKSEEGQVTDGTIEFDGRTVTALDPADIVQLGMFQVMEGRRVFEHLTVEHNLWAGAHTRRSSAELRDDLSRVYDYFPRLRERRAGLAGYLSGGEQQMLAIGRALMARPRLIMLDEPSLGLAPLVVREIYAIVERINRDFGTSILLVEQNVRMAMQVASYVYVMEMGRVVLEGPPAKLSENQDVQEFYLGFGGQGERRNYHDVKHYKRRKRWLS